MSTVTTVSPERNILGPVAIASASTAGVLGAALVVSAIGGFNLLTRAPAGSVEGELTTDLTVLDVKPSPLSGWTTRIFLDSPGEEEEGFGAIFSADGRLLASPVGYDGRRPYRDTTPLRGVPTPVIKSGTKVAVTADPWMWKDDPLGVGAKNTPIRTPNGDLNIIEAGSSKRAVVYVHGRGGNRSTGWWIAPASLDAGWRIALTSYTNDADAPKTGRYMLGGEWPDVAYVMEHLGRQGVNQVVLAGWSMGGNICASYLRARHVDPDSFADHPEVVGLMMDSPALDWSEVLHHAAKIRKVPCQVAHVAMAFGQLIRRVNWRDINHLAEPEHLDLPILTFHGTNDDLVPHAISESLVRNIETARLVTFEGAAHCRSVNADPYRYIAEFCSFLADATQGR